MISDWKDLYASWEANSPAGWFMKDWNLDPAAPAAAPDMFYRFYVLLDSILSEVGSRPSRIMIKICRRTESDDVGAKH